MSDLRDPDAIRRDIERSRQELGESVEALAAKVNVAARARARINDAKRAVGAAWHTALEHKVLVIGAGLVATATVIAAGRALATARRDS